MKLQAFGWNLVRLGLGMGLEEPQLPACVPWRVQLILVPLRMAAKMPSSATAEWQLHLLLAAFPTTWSYMKCHESHAQNPAVTCSGLYRLSCKTLLSTFLQMINTSLPTSTEVWLLEVSLIVSIYFSHKYGRHNEIQCFIQGATNSLGSAVSRHSTFTSFLVDMFVLPQFHAYVCARCVGVCMCAGRCRLCLEVHFRFP